MTEMKKRILIVAMIVGTLIAGSVGCSNLPPTRPVEDNSNVDNPGGSIFQDDGTGKGVTNTQTEVNNETDGALQENSSLSSNSISVDDSKVEFVRALEQRLLEHGFAPASKYSLEQHVIGPFDEQGRVVSDVELSGNESDSGVVVNANDIDGNLYWAITNMKITTTNGDDALLGLTPPGGLIMLRERCWTVSMSRQETLVYSIMYFEEDALTIDQVIALDEGATDYEKLDDTTAVRRGFLQGNSREYTRILDRFPSMDDLELLIAEY